MLTPLGKVLRIWRISRGEILKTMAEKLDIVPPYLSAIENGKREPTLKFINTLKSVYTLSEDEIEQIDEAYFETIDNVSIDISNQTTAHRELSFVFARKFDSLSDEDIKIITKLLNKETTV